jgi:CheY-like chemotaxis protein
MEALRRRPRVLIVDDNRDYTTGLSLLLGVSGCDVESARDGTGAIAAAQARPPDVALLEISLLDMDGFQVAERLRISVGAREILIIALTGYNPEMVTGWTPRPVFDHFLVKPVDFNAILPFIRRSI